jgi:hypothetical protein
MSPDRVGLHRVYRNGFAKWVCEVHGRVIIVSLYPEGRLLSIRKILVWLFSRVLVVFVDFSPDLWQG